MNNTEPIETKQRQRAPLREFPDWEGTPARWLEDYLLGKPDTEWLRLDWRDVKKYGQASITLAAIRHLIPKGKHEYFGGQDRVMKITRETQPTTTDHYKQLVDGGSLTPMEKNRKCDRYSVQTLIKNDDYGMLPINYLGIVKNFADRCLFALALSGTMKILRIQGILDAGDGIINSGIDLAEVPSDRWSRLTGMTPKTLKRTREKLVNQGLIVWDEEYGGTSVWVE